MTEFSSGAVSGGRFETEPVLTPLGKRRVLSWLVDLLLIPILFGIIAGLLLLRAPEGIRNAILIFVNIAWMIFRDAVFSPGRKMVGIKLASLAGEKVTFGQAFVRNTLIIIPFVLVVGYILEFIFCLVKGPRLADGWAKTRVVAA